MLSSQAFILDVSGYLLLKSGENSDIGGCCAALSDQRGFCRSFDYGAIVIFSQKSPFLPGRKLLDPHSSTCIAIDPRLCPTRRWSGKLVTGAIRTILTKKIFIYKYR